MVGYAKLGKDEMYGGVVLGKNRFNKDIPLWYHEIYFNSFSHMSTLHVDLILNLR